MRNKLNKILFALFTTTSCMILASTQVFAITDADVQAAIASSSKEAVSGSVFIWFLCAIAFLKISQKIDSLMATLGVSVGRTGGSMLGELMMAGKVLTGGAKGLLGGAGGGGGGGGGGASGGGAAAGFLSGGLAGAVCRMVNRSATANATGKGGGLLGSAAFNSSLNAGGDYANSIIGQVANGNMARDGSITGDTAVSALNSYLGNTGAGAAMDATDAADTSVVPMDTAAESTFDVPMSDGADTSIPMSPTDAGDVDIPFSQADSPNADIEDIIAREMYTPESFFSADSGGGAGIPTLGDSGNADGDLSDSCGETDSSALTTSAGLPLDMPGASDSIPYSPSGDSTSVDADGSTSGNVVSGGATSIPASPLSDASAAPTDESIFNGAEFADGYSGGDVSIPMSAETAATVASHATFADELDSTSDAAEDNAHIASVAAATATDSTRFGSVDGGTSIHSDSPTIPAAPTALLSTDTGEIAASGSDGASISSLGGSVAGGSAPVVDFNSGGVYAASAPEGSVSTSPGTTTDASTTAPPATMPVTTTTGSGSDGSIPATTPATTPASPASPTTSPTSPTHSGGDTAPSIPQSNPVFSKVEIGGGRITGTETSTVYPSGQPFAMYSASQYVAPEGPHTTMTAKDGTSWYKQYAQPTVEKAPYMNDKNEVRYNEKIVDKLPRAPQRKDRI